MAKLLLEKKKDYSFPELKKFFRNDDLRIRVFIDKYALRDIQGRLVERTPVQMWRRVAREIASVEKAALKKKWERNFHWLLSDFRFIPGGRIMFGAGQPRKGVSLLNCYVIPIKDDSIEAIFDWCREAARTYSYGGGTGVDISILRPRGAPVNNSAIYSTGSVSFMELFSTTTGTIGQAGRRGALMITIRVDHPDVLEFIDSKKNLSKINYANISVRLSEKFMKAVAGDKDFLLWYENKVIGRIEKKVKAKEIWDRLISAAYASAEPGVIFWDTIKRESTTEYNGMEVVTTNPCSEIPLEPYGCCCLGNINLARFVKNRFSDKSEVDWINLEKALRYGTRFLDNVLDYNKDRHALKAQSLASMKSRRIGVGFTGFADMLLELGLKYDSPQALKFTDRLFNRIKHIVYDASVELAQEKGNFPVFDAQKHFQSPFIKRLNKSLQVRIRKFGLRNAALLTVPPVGSGSALAGVSSGIEPVFSLSYTRRSESLSKKEFKVFHPLVREYMKLFKIKSEDELPEIFITAHQIKPEKRVQIQAAIQKHIDHSISSTVNLPQKITKDKVEEIYFLAWKLGCKGITVYREGSREGILVSEKKEEESRRSRSLRIPKSRPAVVLGRTFKMKTEIGNLYVTVNQDEQGPFEVFVQLGKSGSTSMSFTEAIGRLISLALRSGIKAEEIINQLQMIRGLRPIMQDDGTVVFSVPDAVAKALEKFLSDTQKQLTLNGFDSKSSVPKLNVKTETSNAGTEGEICPNCGGVLIFTNGCFVCRDCGYSKCG